MPIVRHAEMSYLNCLELVFSLRYYVCACAIPSALALAFINSFSPVPIVYFSYLFAGGTTDSLTSGSPVESLGAPGSLLSPRGLDGPHGNGSRVPQICVICNDTGVEAALVPCGHNLFCYQCALKLVSQPTSTCPCCSQPASMALRIKK